MIRLPTPFEARARHSVESAAAGGSTCTTCSCCLVTFGLSSVLTSMHFHSLSKVAINPELNPDPAGTQLRPRPAGRTGPSALGFFLPLLTLIAAGIGMVGESFVFAAFVGFGVWSWLWTTVYGDAGRPAWLGFWLSALAFAVMLGIGAFEVKLWLG
jgi:hypothetical protein